MDCRFSYPDPRDLAAGETLGQLEFSNVYKPRSKDQGSAGVKIQAMRRAFPTTHPLHRLNG